MIYAFGHSPMHIRVEKIIALRVTCSIMLKNLKRKQRGGAVDECHFSFLTFHFNDLKMAKIEMGKSILKHVFFDRTNHTIHFRWYIMVMQII